MLNGYRAVYMPNHPRAYKGCGCVYEHILVAEEILGRPLESGECVHHIDCDRTNNNPENLMIFKTRGDHTAYHNGVEPILLSDGTYICRLENTITKIIGNNNKYKYNLCPVCKENYKSLYAKMCIKCNYKLRNEKSNIPIKEELEYLIYTTPFTKIGEKYGVSDNAIRKWCRKYGLPYRKKDIAEIIKEK